MKPDNVYQVFSKCAWLGAATRGQDSLGRNTANGGENRELLAVKAELEYLVGHSGHWHRTHWTGCTGRCIPTCPAFPQTLTTENPNYPQKVPIQREVIQQVFKLPRFMEKPNKTLQLLLIFFEAVWRAWSMNNVNSLLPTINYTRSWS